MLWHLKVPFSKHDDLKQFTTQIIIADGFFGASWQRPYRLSWVADKTLRTLILS